MSNVSTNNFILHKDDFVYHHKVCTTIYHPLSCPLRTTGSVKLALHNCGEMMELLLNMLYNHILYFNYKKKTGDFPKNACRALQSTPQHFFKSQNMSVYS